jgi:tetratricopeptide (TPR) repeat protein
LRARAWATGGAVAFAAMLAAAPVFGLTQQEIDWCAKSAIGSSVDDAIGGCTAAIDSGRWHGPNLAWAFNNRGFAYFLKGDLDPAFADFEQAIRLDPNDAVAFNGRGLVYQARGELDRAIADYDETLRLDPNYLFAFNNRGGAYSDKHDYEHAIADYTEAIRLNSTFAAAIKGRANAYLAKRDFDHAVSDDDALIKLDPKNAAAFYNRGLAYELKGDADRAIADYSEAVQLDPKNDVAFNNRGNVYLLNGHPERAVADYSAAIRLDPKEPGMHFNRGVASFYSGNMSQALADLDAASELNPRLAYAALWRDIVNRHRNLPSPLAQAMTQLDMTKWPAPLVRLYLGQITAEAALAAADDPDPKTKRSHVCEANFFTGKLALQRGAKDEAVRLFRLASSECPENTFVRAFTIAELKALGAQP